MSSTQRTRSPLTLAAFFLILGMALQLSISPVMGAVTRSFNPHAPITAPVTPTPTPSTEPTPTTEPSPSQTTQSTSATAGKVGALATGVVLIESSVAGGEADGTGMVLTSAGEVLTNYHVVSGSTSIKVIIATTGATYSATVVGHDAVKDVALLKLTGASNLETVKLDDGSDAQVGVSVTAVGNASGQGFLSAAPGEILEVDASITIKESSFTGTTATLEGMLETNAGAVPGDSGGPMYDKQGEVVGMTTAGQSTKTRTGSTTTTLSYMVPITTAMEVVNQVRTGESLGTTSVGPRPFLGVSLDPGTTNVTSVDGSGPAAKAGMTKGAIMTKIGNSEVSTQADLRNVLAGLKPGQKVLVTWTTVGGQTRSATITLGTNPAN